MALNNGIDVDNVTQDDDTEDDNDNDSLSDGSPTRGDPEVRARTKALMRSVRAMRLVVPRSQQMCIASLDQGNDLSGEEMMVAASPIADNAEVIEIYEPRTLIDPAINQFLTSAPLAVQSL